MMTQTLRKRTLNEKFCGCQDSTLYAVHKAAETRAAVASAIFWSLEGTEGEDVRIRREKAYDRYAKFLDLEWRARVQMESRALNPDW